MIIVDSHVHCGVQNLSLPFSECESVLKEAGIQGACLSAKAEDIYNRDFSDIDDEETWNEARDKAHNYLLKLARERECVFVYYFVCNDFVVKDLDRGFKGITWRHHAGEQGYDYKDPKCKEMIREICARQMPVLLEETFEHTLEFLEISGGMTPVIIPHLGLLNGGFYRLLDTGIFNTENIYADSALAEDWELGLFLEMFGADKLIFGSDYPNGSPSSQIERLMGVGLNQEEAIKVFGSNILKLLGEKPPNI